MNFLSLDVGTTCCKCQLFSEEGRIVAYHSEEYPLRTVGAERYVYTDEIFSRIKDMMRFAVAAGGFSSVCISSIGESFVLLDRQDGVLFPPMLYTDPRGEEEAGALLRQFGAQALFSRLGLLPQSMFSLSKLLWIRNHRPDLYAKADKVLLMCDYMGYLLTGKCVIDPGLASRTGAFDIARRQFDGELLGELGISPSLFSKPKKTGSVVGELKEELKKELGLAGSVKLVLGSHDQICAALGAGAVKAGDAVDGMGTVECLTAVTDRKPSDVRMGAQGYVCVPFAEDGLYCTYMFNYSNGSLIDWYRKNILHGYRGEDDSFFAYIERRMREGPTGILALPYFAGAATPYQNISAKGAFLNLTTKTTDADIYKAILEGTSMEMRLNAETAKRYGFRVESAVATGGGANSAAWLQIKADIQNIPVRTLRSSEGGLCGCAMLQAVAAGVCADLTSAAARFVQYKDVFLPDAARHAAYEGQYKKYKKLYKTVKEFY